MVYQFMFDVFLFNTQFSELQYWGIGITVLTFVLDIYLTVYGPSEESAAGVGGAGSSSAEAIDQKKVENDDSVL